jgi:uridine kinase
MNSINSINSIIKRNGSIVTFNPEKITNAIFKAVLSVGGQNRRQAESLTEKVLHTLNRIYKNDSIPTVEEIQDIVEKVLIENNHAKTAKAFILYRAERAKIREKKESTIVVEDNIPYKLLWRAFSWNVEHGCESIAKLNNQIKNGNWKQLMMDSEAHYDLEVKKVADKIFKKKEDLKILIVAGPSSSGKTTTILKIGEEMRKQGLSFVTMNLDHYFKNLDQHPKDEYGDHDFESPYALELEMINDHLSKLIQGKTIRMPHYDFKTGLRKDHVTEFKLQPGELILIDSLHGLFEGMTHSIAREQKFKFYIEALCQIKDMNGEFVRWADLRMLRRMIRDSLHRSYHPLRTVGHWHYVRRSEKQYIVPFIKTVDHIFNGSLAYELPIYKNFLEVEFPAIIKAFEKDPKKADAYLRAKRVYHLLHSLEKFPDMDAIPKNSCLREFIGGSTYHY